MHKKWTDCVELTKKTSHGKSRDFLRKPRLKTTELALKVVYGIKNTPSSSMRISKGILLEKRYLN